MRIFELLSDNKECFVSFRYKGHYIQCHYNSTIGRDMVSSLINHTATPHRTVSGAKRYITKQLKECVTC